MPKYVKDVFVDYTVENNLINSEIENINLFKKTNKLQVNVKSSEPIYLKDIASFENYAVKRFNVAKTMVDINYSEGVEIVQNIPDEWNNIVNYIAKKEPFSRAILSRTNVEVDNKNVVVKLAIKGADFLLSKKFDKGLEHLFSNLYNQDYKVQFVEELDKDFKAKFEEHVKKQEQEFLKQLQEENNRLMEERQDENNLKSQEKEIEKQVASSQASAPLPEIEEEITPLIYGRSMNIRSDLVKIADISVDTDKVCLEGEVVRMDARELKNEKTLLMFDLYDGSSTMTCKAFVKNEEFKKIEKRVKSAKGLKIDGVAKYDPFAKEIGIMANTIIETDGLKKEIRMDNAPVKRVELHMHTKMSQMDAITSVTDLINPPLNTRFIVFSRWKLV